MLSNCNVNAKTIEFGSYGVIKSCLLTCTEAIENIDKTFNFITVGESSIIEDSIIEGSLLIRNYSSVCGNTIKINSVFGGYGIDAQDFCEIKNNDISIVYGTGKMYAIAGITNYSKSTDNTIKFDETIGLNDLLSRFTYRHSGAEGGIVKNNYYNKYDGIDVRYGVAGGVGEYYCIDDNFKRHYGTNEQRPLPDMKEVGFTYFDTTLGKTIWWNEAKIGRASCRERV